MRPEIIAVLVVPLFLATFVGFWCLIVRMISHASGWQALAKYFAAPSQPQGQSFPMESVFMNSARYKNAVTIGVSQSGLYLKTLFLFRVGHEPLLIPWQSLRGFRIEKQLWMSLHTADIVVPDGGIVTVAFYNKQIAAAMEEYAALPVR